MSSVGRGLGDDGEVPTFELHGGGIVEISGLPFLLYNFCVKGGRLFGTFPWLFSL